MFSPCNHKVTGQGTKNIEKLINLEKMLNSINLRYTDLYIRIFQIIKIIINLKFK